MNLFKIQFFIRVENILSALLVAVLDKQACWRMEFIQGSPYIFCFFLGQPRWWFGTTFKRMFFIEVYGSHEMTFMVFELLTSDFLCNFKLFALLKVGNSLFSGFVDLLFIGFSACSDWVSEFLEPSNNVLCNFELQVWNVLVLNVFYGSLDEITVDTFGQHRTCLENESHFLLCQMFSSWKVLIKQKLSWKVNFVVLVEHPCNLLTGKGLKLFLGDKLQPAT